MRVEQRSRPLVGGLVELRSKQVVRVDDLGDERTRLVGPDVAARFCGDESCGSLVIQPLGCFGGALEREEIHLLGELAAVVAVRAAL